MNTSRLKYRRSLQVSGLIRLALLGAITAAVGGAFVVIKNRQHGLANAKGQMEGEIEQFNKQIDTLEMRILAMIDHKVLQGLLDSELEGCGLVAIESPELISLDSPRAEQYALYREPRGEEKEF
ncbi:MAG: hypothetical protein ACR2RV_08785 [Verrucomicrobiales bacterium]